ncbi:toll/interleukin-1 receptor domain-containing protein [Mesobacillus foraminis]|uniref:toll/interleukin-1 receptor domain-containing protein n=1 Tax=Mesobacillus foraminis TaxID=279826 RepID=UPI001BE795F9|nr:toll/interleukin-1 receptor domain-containing protein [Mesobacillus foraminis]MBT2757878.1 toll/interleukin-1 receptor domain-containing protein [Mesobacillus foraminis]
MYAGFNLDMSDELELFKQAGNTIYNAQKKKISDELSKFLLDDGSLNGTDMQNNWFPQIKADVFISHSHNDREKAIALAGWLKRTFDLDVFIDSAVWGSADELLKKIDDRYCKNPGSSTYSYEKRNFSTSHIHTTLSTALTMIIDQTECLFFLNTPQSIDVSSVINSTKSPWIYYEIGITKYIRKHEPDRPKGIIKKGMFENAQDLTIQYKLDMDHLYDISQFDLQKWQGLFTKYNQNHPLDVLYGMRKLLMEHLVS